MSPLLDLAGAGNLLIDGRDGRTRRWMDLDPPAASPTPTAALVTSSDDAFTHAYAHAVDRSELLLVASTRVDRSLRAELATDGFRMVEGASVHEPSTHRAGERDRIWVLTSGSTGRAKRVGHSLESLTTVTSDQPPRRWLCPYSPGTYAWWQLVTLSMGQRSQDLVAVDPSDLIDWPRMAVAHEVDAVSGTPTFWRQSMLQGGPELAAAPLRQITLGGEPVDQAVLDELGALFPSARISWIYASSEVGAAIVVHDRRAGFPAAWLDRRLPGRPVVSVEGAQLLVSSPHHGAGLDGLVATGDRVELRQDRVHIVGRLDSDEINVGGTKISAGAVRAVLQGHPDVAWAKISGRRAPLVGRVVVADVVVAGEAHDQHDLERQLRQWCAHDLPQHAVPRSFRFLDSIPVRETLKSDV